MEKKMENEMETGIIGITNTIIIITIITTTTILLLLLQLLFFLYGALRCTEKPKSLPPPAQRGDHVMNINS